MVDFNRHFKAFAEDADIGLCLDLRTMLLLEAPPNEGGILPLEKCRMSSGRQLSKPVSYEIELGAKVADVINNKLPPRFLEVLVDACSSHHTYSKVAVRESQFGGVTSHYLRVLNGDADKVPRQDEIVVTRENLDEVFELISGRKSIAPLISQNKTAQDMSIAPS